MINTKNPWLALEAVPGLVAVEAEWRAKFGDGFESAKGFLRPNGKLASSHPCTVQRGCGCEHDVVIHDPEDIVAVCRCGRGCEPFPLKRSEIVVYELDRAALDAAIVETFKLIKESVFMPLSENVGFAGNRKLRLLRPLEDILSPFRTANLPSPKDNGGVVFFPTPPDATWGDVSIKLKDRHTVSVRVKSVTGVFHYAQMGMANKKNSEPTKQWELLEAFADEHGVLDWSSNKADRRNQKRREILATNLRDFFRIEGDPFRLTDDGKDWQALFLISPDE